MHTSTKSEIRTEKREPVYTRRVPEDTVLYAVVSEQLSAFFAHAENAGRAVPAFVARELTRYLECGILAHGFVRVRCPACRHERLVAFSCKGRGFCPSCGGRRMADTAAFLVDRVIEDQPLLAEIYAASVRSRIAMGERAGLGVLRVGQLVDPEEVAFVTGRRVRTSPARSSPMIDGVSLHANVAVPKNDRRRLEKLCRYIARPPVSTERLSQLPDGRLLYRLKRRWRDGTTHVVFERIELVEKLASIVPPPRIHMVRYHGLLAPRAEERRQIVPAKTAANGEALSGTEGIDSCVHAPKRWTAWATLMQRVFAVDVLQCPKCGGKMRILAAIHPPEATTAILESLGLSPRAPPLAAAAASYSLPIDPA